MAASTPLQNQHQYLQRKLMSLQAARQEQKAVRQEASRAEKSAQQQAAKAAELRSYSSLMQVRRVASSFTDDWPQGLHTSVLLDAHVMSGRRTTVA
jgi:hypothetical protein